MSIAHRVVVGGCLVAIAATNAVAEPDPGPRSPSTALALSLGGTAVSYGMFFGSFAMPDSWARTLIGSTGMIGTMGAPSLGHWYVGDYQTVGLGIRAIGGAAITTAGIMSFDFRPPTATEKTIFVTGAVLWVAGGIYDIVDAPLHAKRQNDQRGTLEFAGMAPIVSSSMKGFGLAATW